MKKVVLILAVILIAIGIAYYAYLPKQVKPISMLVPRDACFFFSVREGEIFWKKIEESAWWKRASGVEELARMRQAIVSAAERPALELGLDLDREHLLGLLGKEVGVALIPGVKSGGTLLVLARDRSSYPSKVMNNLENSGLYRCDSSKYRRSKMLLVKSPAASEPLRGVCRIADILAIAISDEDPLAVLRQVVDLVHDGGKDSLRQSARFQKVMSISGEAPECSAGMYFDFSGVEEGDDLLPDGIGSPLLSAGDVDLSQLAGLKKSLLQSLKQVEAGGGIARLAGGLETTLYYIPAVSRMDEPSRDLLRIKPKRLKALKLIPSDQLMYSASLCGDAKDLWNSFLLSLQQSNPGLAPVVDRAVREWEADAGVSLEKDVLPLVGDELAYCLGTPGGSQLLPIPVVGLIIRVKDPQKAGDIMDAVVRSLTVEEDSPGSVGVTEADSAPSPPRGTEQYKGHTLTAIPTGLMGFQPAYAFLGDFLVVASDGALMREIIDVWLGQRESVKVNARYRSLSEEFGEEANSITFVDVERSLVYLRTLSKVISSLMNLAADEGDRKADFEPFLDCMEVVRYIYSRTASSEEVVKQVIFVDAEDLKE
jgi:hypothetical protein